MSEVTDRLDGLEPQKVAKGKFDETATGGELHGAVVTSPLLGDDWTPILALFTTTPEAFEVVDDTVRCSTWQQSARTKDGDRDVVRLYAYSARFRKINRDTIRPEIVESWRAALQVTERTPPAAAPAAGGTYTILVADPQLGKKGTDEAVDNWKRGVTEHMVAADMLGTDVAAIHVGFMGDEHENVVNSYGNQPHTVELNRSAQLELDYDLRVWTMKTAQALGLPVSASSVISNHGEWTRNGGKEPVTSQGDNSSTHIARQVAKLFDELEPFTGQHIDWTIGAGDPAITLTLSGIKTYFSHGYIEKGKGASTEIRTRSAIERQILGRTETLGDVRLYYMAHYHHAYFQEFEGRTQFGCPAIEAERSSEYMLNQYGVWSPPGVLGMLVGEHSRRGWSDLNVF